MLTPYNFCVLCYMNYLKYSPKVVFLLQSFLVLTLLRNLYICRTSESKSNRNSMHEDAFSSPNSGLGSPLSTSPLSRRSPAFFPGILPLVPGILPLVPGLPRQTHPSPCSMNSIHIPPS